LHLISSLFAGFGFVVEIETRRAGRANVARLAGLTVGNRAGLALLRHIVKIFVVGTHETFVLRTVVAILLTGLTCINVQKIPDFAAEAVKFILAVGAVTAVKIATFTRLTDLIVQIKVAFTNCALAFINCLVTVVELAFLAGVGFLFQNEAIFAYRALERLVLAVWAVGRTGLAATGHYPIARLAQVAL